MMKRLLLIALLLAAVLALPIQAEFFQCPPNCVGSANADVINGSPIADNIAGGLGNDLIFAGDGRDVTLMGQEDDDLIFGGLGSDLILGGPGNDTLIPGPDDAVELQSSAGEVGNDIFIVLVGETVNCQLLVGNEDFDILHLIGFGPYIAEFPFGLPEPIEDLSAIVVQDPIAGGYIIISVGDVNGIERINGLATPNVTWMDNDTLTQFIIANCSTTLSG
jgi:hypothetical protein